MSIFKKLFGSSRRTAERTSGPAQAEIMSFYIFDSNRIDESVPGMYGAYAQGQLLMALHRVVQPLGGWEGLSYLVGCHGDLFEKDLFGKPTGTTVLADWFKLISLDALALKSRLATDFLDELRVDSTKIGFIPYAIGVWPISDSIAFSTHKTLLSSDVIGYIGNFSVEPNPRLPFVETRLPSMHKAGLSGSDAIFSAIASILCLPIKIGIRTDGQYFSWLVSEDEMAKLGLSKLPEA